MGVLENTIREELNLSAGRIMGVLDPLKITITNYSENEQEIIKAPVNPNIDDSSRDITISKKYILKKQISWKNLKKIISDCHQVKRLD